MRVPGTRIRRVSLFKLQPRTYKPPLSPNVFEFWTRKSLGIRRNRLPCPLVVREPLELRYYFRFIEQVVWNWLAGVWVHWSQHIRCNEVGHLHLQQLPRAADRWQLHEMKYSVRVFFYTACTKMRVTNTQPNATSVTVRAAAIITKDWKRM